MSALVRQLALVSESNSAGMSDLLRVSAALQKQASRDLAPIWELSATVDAFAKLDDVPDGYWPMIIKDDIGVEAAGVHKDKDGQPFALIASSPDFDNWALNCSHEMLEMLVDPSLDRQVTGDSPMDGQGRVSFLVEVCDPSGAADFGYSVNGILMSDFYTPHFFDPVASAGVPLFVHGMRLPGRGRSFAAAICRGRNLRRDICGSKSGSAALCQRSVTSAVSAHSTRAFAVSSTALPRPTPLRLSPGAGKGRVLPA